MNKKMMAAVMAAAVAFGAGRAVWAVEKDPAATRDLLHSTGKIVYQENEDKVVLDSRDLYEIADRLDRFKVAVSNQLASMGTYLTKGDGMAMQTDGMLKVSHVKPAEEQWVDPRTVDFNALLESLAASQSVPADTAVYGYEEGAVLYRTKEGALTTAEEEAVATLQVKAAAAENLSAGTAAWVDGHLLLGTGADNVKYYEEGHGETGGMIGNIISILYSGVNETKDYALTGKDDGKLSISIDSKVDAGPYYINIVSDPIQVWDLEEEEKRLLTKLKFDVTADTSGVRDGENSVNGGAYINYVVYDQNGQAIGSGSGKAKEPLVIDVMSLPISTQYITIEANGEVYVYRKGHECGHGKASIDFHGIQATYLIN